MWTVSYKNDHFFIKYFLMQFTLFFVHSRATGHDSFNQISYQSDCFYSYILHIYIMRLTDQIEKDALKKTPKKMVIIYVLPQSHKLWKVRQYSQEKHKRYIFLEM